MNLKRMMRDIGYMARLTSTSRAEYARQKRIFAAVGDDVRLPFMRLPLYSKLVTFYNNIEVTSGVSFITHDAIHGVLNNLTNCENVPETVKIRGRGMRSKKKSIRLRCSITYLSG